MERVRSLTKWTGIGLLLVLIALSAILVVALTTEAGARSALHLVATRVAPGLELEEVEGTLRGPLTLSGVTGTIPPLEFDIERVTVDWRPLSLLRKRVHVDSVRVAGVNVALTYDTTGVERSSADSLVGDTLGIELPIAVVLDKLEVEAGSFFVSDDIRVDDISASVSGTLSDYQVNATGTFTETNVGDVRVEASGRGSINGVRMEQLRAVTLDGVVNGSASATWLPRVEWHATMDAADLAPSFLPPSADDWPGQVSFTASLEGSVVDGLLEMDARVDTLFGTLRGEPITGVVKVGMRGPEFLLDVFDVDWGNVRVDASGLVGADRLDLAFDIWAPDLSEVLPRAGGTVVAQGQLAGSPSRPVVTATATADDVTLGRFSLQRADAQVDVDWHDRGNNDVDVRIENLWFTDQVVDSVVFLLNGYRSEHELKAAIASSEANILLGATGGLSEWTWSGQVRELDVGTRHAGDWQLDAPATLVASDTAVALEEVCLLADEGDFCLGGSWATRAGWQFSSSMNELPFLLLQPLLPDGYSIAGALDGELSARGVGGTPERLEADLRPTAGSFGFPARDTVASVAYREARARVHVDGDSLRGNVAVLVAGNDSSDFGRLSAELGLGSLSRFVDEVLADTSTLALPDDWTLRSSIDSISLSLLGPFLPYRWGVWGTVSGELSAAGESGIPEFVELDLRPSPGRFEYALGDTAAIVRYHDAYLTVSGAGDSLRSRFGLSLPGFDGTEVGGFSAEIAFPSLPELIDEWSREGFVAAARDGFSIHSSVDQIPLSLGNSFLPERFTMSGVLDGDLDATVLSDGTIEGRFELLPRSASSQSHVARQVQSIRLTDARLWATADSDGIRGEANLVLVQPDSAEYAWLSGRVTLPGYTRVDQPLSSQPLDASVAGELDLSLLDALSENLSNTSGRFVVDLTAANTIGDMVVSGHYELRGQTEVVSLGIDLQDIDIRADDTPEGDLEIEGGISSGGGRLTIRGTSPAVPTREMPARLSIRGEDFQAMQSDQIDLVVSPDLEVLIGGRSVDVSGEVVVPRAMIEILEVPEAAVGVSEDAVYLGVVEEEPVAPIDVTANVSLVLGEEVRFRGFGFNTYLDGTIVTTTRPEQRTQGRGELSFREGVYRGYGQNLTVEPGTLIFAGPIDDPTLDVRAYRRADDGTRAGFLINGSVSALNVGIWSDPTKSESDAFSYILFGYPASQATGSDQAQAGSAAAILGGNMLAMAMASEIGLDEARIETGARRQDAAFYAGKYLSPKIYVAYGVGLYEAINVLRVRYLISRKFTLQLETGTRDSGDILYRIEF